MQRESGSPFSTLIYDRKKEQTEHTWYHKNRREITEMTEKMKTWIRGFVGGVAACVVVGSVGYFICFGSFPLIGDQALSLNDLAKASKIAKLVDTYYLDYKDEDEKSQYTLEDGMYSGLVASLQDPYSGYYSEDDYKQLQESTQGAYTGVGLTMSKDPDSGEVSVVDLAEGGPAEQAGIQKGDILTAVDGEDITGKELSEISKIIREDNKKQVVLTIERDGTATDITVSLEKVEVTVVKSRMLDDSLGYIQITEFTDGTSEQFKKAYSELNEQGMKGLLVDLRENPGGLLTAVCDTLEQILPKGMIVYTEDKSGHQMEHTCKGETPIEIPMVVLVNENSASAAEIFSGAVKDHGVGTLVGTTTFGKGIVQQTFSLGDGSAVKLTTSKYYTPNGVNIQGTGITPDVEVDWPEDAEEFTSPSQFNELSQEEWESKDAQMKKAIEVLDEEVAKAQQ